MMINEGYDIQRRINFFFLLSILTGLYGESHQLYTKE
jgi:hypothetical protein